MYSSLKFFYHCTPFRPTDLQMCTHTLPPPNTCKIALNIFESRQWDKFELKHFSPFILFPWWVSLQKHKKCLQKRNWQVSYLVAYSHLIWIDRQTSFGTYAAVFFFDSQDLHCSALPTISIVLFSKSDNKNSPLYFFCDFIWLGASWIKYVIYLWQHLTFAVYTLITHVYLKWKNLKTTDPFCWIFLLLCMCLSYY